MNKNQFIVIEGPDGCGKTTLIEGLKEKFKEEGTQDNYLFIKEPGGSEIGEFARNWVHKIDAVENDMVAAEALYIFSASRLELINKTILPALTSGKTIISDRFALSSAVYQDLIPEWNLQKLVSAVMENLSSHITVDKTFFLQANPASIIGRIEARKDEGGLKDKVDGKDINFFNMLLAKYNFLLNGDAIPKKLLGKVFTINAEKSKEQIVEEVMKKIKESI